MQVAHEYFRSYSLLITFISSCLIANVSLQCPLLLKLYVAAIGEFLCFCGMLGLCYSGAMFWWSTGVSDMFLILFPNLLFLCQVVSDIRFII